MQVVRLTVLLGHVQIRTNKRYAAASGQGFTMTEVAAAVERDFGKVDVLVHSLANGPEVTKPLLETSRKARMPCYCTTWLCKKRKAYVTMLLLDTSR